jgi:branched-chain amino acid transport system ATP-binding protein
MVEALLEVRGLQKSFGALMATANVDLDVHKGEAHAVIGPNGAGKTTLIAQLAGELKPDAGSITFLGRDITHLPIHKRSSLGVARSFQITSIFKSFTVLDNVALSVQSRVGHSFRFWRNARGVSQLRGPAREILEKLELAERSEEIAGNLSYGEQRKVEIAMALAARPKLLLLDEPTAGMGGEESERMVALLHRLKGELALVMVEHDMDAVFSLADRITVLVYGRVIVAGSPDEVRAHEEVRKAYLGQDGISERLSYA